MFAIILACFRMACVELHDDQNPAGFDNLDACRARIVAMQPTTPGKLQSIFGNTVDVTKIRALGVCAPAPSDVKRERTLEVRG